MLFPCSGSFNIPTRKEYKEICRKQMPELEEVNGRRVRCFKYMKGWEESAK